MGGCVAVRDANVDMLCQAYQTFRKIDSIGKGFINSQDIRRYFGAYSESSRKIMLREVDLNGDGVITLNQWIGYWELVKRAGYKVVDIKKQLCNISKGQLCLNFPNIKSYDPQRPRQTVVNSIVEDLKSSQNQNIPIFLQIR